MRLETWLISERYYIRYNSNCIKDKPKKDISLAYGASGSLRSSNFIPILSLIRDLLWRNLEFFLLKQTDGLMRLAD